MKKIFILGFLVLLGICSGEILHGPNVNPSNFAVLMEWEKYTGRKADVIGDNFSANTWGVYREAPRFREKRQKNAMAEQLSRWADAFDGDGFLDDKESSNLYFGKPKGALSDYVIELAIPMFPNFLEDEHGNMVDSATVSDRWEMGSPSNRHYREAKRAFQALASALVSSGLSEANIRLAWEFSGDWFSWGIDPKGGAQAGTPQQFKDCWKFIYLTMEEVNPKFSWGWCSTVGYDHFDPSDAFPEFPGVNFPDRADQKDKILVDYISVDIYDSDGESYYKRSGLEHEGGSPMLGYWNTHDKERAAAFDSFRKKVFEGKGHLAGEGESKAYGLRYFKEFAQRKKLPFGISEWGPWANYVPATRGGQNANLLRSAIFGGDDNPDFVNGLFQWVRENDVKSAVLFEFYNGGEGDVVDHTLLPEYWNSAREGRPRLSFYPKGTKYAEITNQSHPRAAEAYLQNLRAK